MKTQVLEDKKSRMCRSAELGIDFWNDSCDLKELGEAVANGAVGATSNPVIVLNVVQGDRATWIPVLDRLIKENPTDAEDEIAWRLVERIGRDAAALLEPVYRRTKGKKGFLSMQVNPQFYTNAEKMTAHAKILAAVAKNVAIKLPATEAGIAAMEEVVAAGINVNATVSFTVAQAVAAAEACERGLERAKKSGADMSRLHPYITIMIGRVDDHIKGLLDAGMVAVDPGCVHWAGVAVFKRAHEIFLEKGYRSTLLAAAYRNIMHWTELVGEDAILSIPYKWWKMFEASKVEVRKSLAEPVPPQVLKALLEKFPDFRRAYEPEGLSPAEFARFGPSVKTLAQFLDGYQKLLALVRERMLAA